MERDMEREVFARNVKVAAEYVLLGVTGVFDGDL